MNKLKIFWLITFYVSLIVQAVPVKAAQTPFEACKKEVKDCATCTLPPELKELSNPFQLLTMAPANSLSFLTMVAATVRDSYLKAIGNVDAKIACFQGSTSPSCSKEVAELKKKLQTDTANLHKELGLARSVEGLYEKEFISAKKNQDIDYKLNALSWNTPNPLKKLTALPADQKAAEEEYKIARDFTATKKMQEVYAKNNASITGKGVFQANAIKSVVAQHKQNALNTINFENPLLAYLPEATRTPQGNYAWSDANILSALKSQKATLMKQNARVEDAIREQNLEFSRLTGASFINATAKRWLGKEKLELMDFIVMGPAVEKVLKQRPELCQLATAMASRYEIKKAQNGAAVMIGSLAAFGGAGVGAAAAGATAASVDIGMGMAGLAFGTAFTYDSYYKMKDTAETARSAGNDQLVVTPAMLAAANAEFQAALAFSPLNFIGTGAAGKAVYSLTKSGLRTAQALTTKEGQKGFAEVSKRVMLSLKNKSAKTVETITSSPKNLVSAYKEQLEAMRVPKPKQLVVAACLALTFGASEGHTPTAAEQKKCNEANMVLAGLKMETKSLAKEAEAVAPINYNKVLESFGADTKDIASKNMDLMKRFELEKVENRLTYDRLKMQMSEDVPGFKALKPEEQDSIVLSMYDNMSKKGVAPREEAERMLSNCTSCK